MHHIISSSSDMAINIKIGTSSMMTLTFSLSLDTTHRGAATGAGSSNTNSYSTSLDFEMCSYIVLGLGKVVVPKTFQKCIDDMVPTTSVDQPGSATDHL